MNAPAAADKLEARGPREESQDRERQPVAKRGAEAAGREPPDGRAARPGALAGLGVRLLRRQQRQGAKAEEREDVAQHEGGEDEGAEGGGVLDEVCRVAEARLEAAEELVGEEGREGAAQVGGGGEQPVHEPDVLLVGGLDDDKGGHQELYCGGDLHEEFLAKQKVLAADDVKDGARREGHVDHDRGEGGGGDRGAPVCVDEVGAGEREPDRKDAAAGEPEHLPGQVLHFAPVAHHADAGRRGDGAERGGGEPVRDEGEEEARAEQPPHTREVRPQRRQRGRGRQVRHQQERGGRHGERWQREDEADGLEGEAAREAAAVLGAVHAKADDHRREHHPDLPAEVHRRLDRASALDRLAHRKGGGQPVGSHVGAHVPQRGDEHQPGDPPCPGGGGGVARRRSSLAADVARRVDRGDARGVAAVRSVARGDVVAAAVGAPVGIRQPARGEREEGGTAHAPAQGHVRAPPEASHRHVVVQRAEKHLERPRQAAERPRRTIDVAWHVEVDAEHTVHCRRQAAGHDPNHKVLRHQPCVAGGEAALRGERS
mmetsp:Transcript_8890/g.29109  ORF Transcript_8890/g.29109 Transcript_8890/m.29109 type:complete len:544 (-) Transcript_8890:34-1665(-)